MVKAVEEELTDIAIAHTDTESIDKKCKAILARGNVIRFSGRGVVKHVSEWNPDGGGDLTACWSTGKVLYVCPYAMDYTITEITAEEAKKERE